ncbi:hypothetical protein QBC38DRAFT_43030 [Podospora fimiseda]|uniref:Protein NO VEIN C-terminal domain-containing protein n=1 Tax=Podospora fimiseda TaxID=252190 RepID=A0AAN7BI86_9PEZI|nr:hypothetical protein QBC38DRAFT_43030 [Podospora fimiseda]
MASKLWILFSGLILLSLGANVLFLLSCLTPTIKEIALYRVNVTQLAQNLQIQGLNNSRDVSHLIHPALPTYWYWGISGICDVHEDETVNCRQKFLPTQGLLNLIEESLRDRLSNDTNDSDNNTEQIVQDVVSAWNTTVSKPRVATFVARKERGLLVRLKASAALAIVAIVLDSIFAIIVPCLVKGKFKKGLSTLPVLSGLVAAAAGTLAILSMKYGVRGMVNTGEHGGPAIIIIFVGVALKALPIALASWLGNRYEEERLPTTRPPGPWPPGPPGDIIQYPPVQPPTRPPIIPDSGSVDTTHAIGYRGEKYIFNLFQRRSIPGWSYHNWTSKLRKSEGLYPSFDEIEWRYSDFTYPREDVDTRVMARMLSGQGATILPEWMSNPTCTYHIEVKTTRGRTDTTFYVSEHQVRMMDNYQDHPNHAYILARVYNVDNPQRIGVDWISNPRKRTSGLYFDGPYQNEEGGWYYKVTMA